MGAAGILARGQSLPPLFPLRPSIPLSPFFFHPIPPLHSLPPSPLCGALSIMPFLFRCEAAPLNPGGSLGERYKLPQRGPGPSPGCSDNLDVFLSGETCIVSTSLVLFVLTNRL